jgi:hypothetical protein
VTWPWRSPEATRRALADRVAARHPVELRQQRLREIAYRRLLVRLFAVQSERWVVKGGAALLLRLDPNRTSNDIDLAYIAQAGEHGVAVEALVSAAAHDAGDFFSFDVGADQGITVDDDHPLERAISVPVTARVGGTVFAAFRVDLGLPRDDVLAIDWVSAEATLTGEPAVDGIPAVAVLALPAQLADKICALFERHGRDRRPSSRARDLADIAMIATQKELDGSSLTAAVRQEEQRRFDARTLLEPLPDALRLADEQVADWRRRWAKATRAAPISFDDALTVTAAFIDPVLADAVDGKQWIADDQRWA